MVKVCSVCKTEQSKITADLTFHSLPKNPIIQKEWRRVLNKENEKSIVVCSKHFKSSDYRELCEKKLLKGNAVPQISMCIPNDELSSDYHNDSTIGNDGKEIFTDITNIESTDVNDGYDIPTDISDSKSKRDIENELAAPIRKRLCLKNLGNFRREEFTNDESWNRFVNSYQKLNKQITMLKRKNQRMKHKVKAFSDVMKELRKKNLLTDFF